MPSEECKQLAKELVEYSTSKSKGCGCQTCSTWAEEIRAFLRKRGLLE